MKNCSLSGGWKRDYNVSEFLQPAVFIGPLAGAGFAAFMK